MKTHDDTEYYLSSVINCENAAEAYRHCPEPNAFHRIELHKDGSYSVVRLQPTPVQKGQVKYVG